MNYYGIDYDDSYLMHYGVPGMKWGIRKSINNAKEKRKNKQILEGYQNGFNKAMSKHDDKKTRINSALAAGAAAATGYGTYKLLAKRIGKKKALGNAALYGTLAGVVALTKLPYKSKKFEKNAREGAHYASALEAYDNTKRHGEIFLNRNPEKNKRKYENFMREGEQILNSYDGLLDKARAFEAKNHQSKRYEYAAELPDGAFEKMYDLYRRGKKRHW